MFAVLVTDIPKLPPPFPLIPPTSLPSPTVPVTCFNQKLCLGPAKYPFDIVSYCFYVPFTLGFSDLTLFFLCRPPAFSLGVGKWCPPPPTPPLLGPNLPPSFGSFPWTIFFFFSWVHMCHITFPLPISQLFFILPVPLCFWCGVGVFTSLFYLFPY